MTDYIELDVDAFEKNDEDGETCFPVKLLCEIDYEWQKAEPDVGIFYEGFVLHSCYIKKALSLDNGKIIENIENYDLFFDGEEFDEESEAADKYIIDMLESDRQCAMADAAIERWEAKQEMI